MDRPVRERLGERIVDEAVLVDQREAGEARARDRHLEVVAAAGSVVDRDLGRVGERGAKQDLERAVTRPTVAAARRGCGGLCARSARLADSLPIRGARRWHVRSSLAALFSFMLPFVPVTADRRIAEATGFELATRDVTFHGHVRPGSFRGEASAGSATAEAPALVAFVMLVSPRRARLDPVARRPDGRLAFGDARSC